jgi:D-alanyl-D-alanine carboxypeptidase
MLLRMRVLAILCLLCGLAGAESRRVTGYVNGRPIALRVVSIGWAEVEERTARAFLVMQEAAARDDVELEIWSGFRTHERQAELYARWRRGEGNLAARPGHSRHQSGQALDLVLDEDTFAWLTANARRFGFRRTVAGEPWHWEYVGRASRAAGSRPRGRSAGQTQAPRRSGTRTAK